MINSEEKARIKALADAGDANALWRNILLKVMKNNL